MPCLGKAHFSFYSTIHASWLFVKQVYFPLAVDRHLFTPVARRCSSLGR